MGFLLFIVATIIWIPATLINICVVIFKNAKRHGFFKILNGYFETTAVDIDRFGNHNFRTGLNTLFITKEGYKFGNFRETMSSVLGKNQRDKTLTKAGKILVAILDWLDNDHCAKSINENV